MNEDELYNLAVQAGMVPGGQYPGQPPAPPPQDPFDPSLAAQYPHPADGPPAPSNGPVTTTNPTPESQTQAASYGKSRGTSSSSRGFNEGQYGKVSKTDAELQGAWRSADAKAAAEGAPDMAREDAARKAQQDATHAVAAATVSKIMEEGHQSTLMANLQRDFADEEAKATMLSQEQSKQGMANYVSALADFRATKIDPGQLWGGMTGGQRVGTLAAVFAHDFLGAQGIHTSAMDTLNHAIDRNIAAQEQNLKTKGEVAEGFKSLWYMQRNQSASDAEARARVRGFMLENMKQQITAHMSSFEAGLATAQGQAAVAKLDEESAKNLFEIKKHIDQNAQGLRSQATQAWQAKLQAAMHSQSMAQQSADRAQRERFHKQDMDAKNPGIQAGDFLVNPETNKGEWVRRKGVSDAEWAKAKEVIIATEPFNKAVQELRDFERSLPPSIDPLVGTRLNDEQRRMYHAIQLRLAHSMVKANGERATDKDVDQYMESIPGDTVFTNGGVERILADTQAYGFVNPQAWVRQYADDVPAEFQMNGPKNQLYAGAKADANAVASGEDKRKSRDQENFEKDLGRLHGPHSEESVDEPGAFALKAHTDFATKYPQFGDDIGKHVKPGEVTEFEMGVVHLAQQAKEISPDGNLTPNAVRAREALKREAEPFMKQDFPGADADWRGAYAAFALSNLSEHDTSFPSKDPGRPDTSPVTSTNYDKPFGR